MRNKKIRKIFLLIALFFLFPWPVAYAYNPGGSTVNQSYIRIEATEIPSKSTWTVHRQAIGGVNTPINLFHINATDNAGDIRVTLYLTNAHELSHHYKYLILKIGVYSEDKCSSWVKIAAGNNEANPDSFITMRDCQASFTLPGLAKYNVTIDNGSFYCTSTGTDGGSLSPQFFLVVD